MGVQCSEVLVDGGVASGSTTLNRLRSLDTLATASEHQPTRWRRHIELSIAVLRRERGDATRVKTRLRALSGIASDESARLPW
jgi:hypothetical protein